MDAAGAKKPETLLTRFNVGHATDIGRKRSQNQDSLAVFPELGLFIVADGMGGHQGGETASAMAVEIVPEAVRRAQSADPAWDPRKVIVQAIQEANQAIFDRACKTPMLRGMGTTTTALLFKDDLLAIGHVGDSRCYYFRRTAPPASGSGHLFMWQATRDHSLVQEKLRAGLITRAELRTDRMKNVITRSVGFERDVEVEVYQMRPGAGDVFLLCSDGLSGLMQDSAIQTQVEKDVLHAHDTQGAVKRLIEGANHNGGDDNITSIVVELLERGKAL